MPEETLTTNVVKNSENIIQFELLRTPKGLKVTTKVVPRVEDFFKTFTLNATKPLALYTKKWMTVGDDNPSVYFSDNFRELMHSSMSGAQPYTLDALGKNIVENTDYGKRINLSFLRLVGASNPKGISVTMDQMISTPELLGLKTTLREAAKQFYIDFMRPVGVTVTVTSTEFQY